MNSRSFVWVFACVWLAVTAYSGAQAFGRCSDRSAVTMIEWALLGGSLGFPLIGVWNLFARSAGPDPVQVALRYVFLGYLPLWLALRVMSRCLTGP